jgi:hypothetical protein
MAGRLIEEQPFSGLSVIPEPRQVHRFFGFWLEKSLNLRAQAHSIVRLFAERQNNMTEPYHPRKYVVGPDGSPLTIADLPAPGTTRWVIRRKAEVVAAVRGGLLSLEEACRRYMLTVEEFLAWQRSIDRHGLAGLRTTRIQQYRPVVPMSRSCGGHRCDGTGT